MAAMAPWELLSAAIAERLNGAEDVEFGVTMREAPAPDWHVRVRSGQAALHEGPPARPAFGLTAHVEDWRDLLEGAATVRACLIDGRLRLAGDVAVARRVVARLLAG